jgi:ferrous-iron efflux pump FieF
MHNPAMALMVRRPATARAARERPALVAMVVSLLLAGLKLFGYVITGSAAMLAAAVDSATDTLVSGVSAWTVRFAGTPADAGHPFGHGKIEHLSALFQSVLLAGAAVFVLITPFREDTTPHRLREPVAGIAIGVISILVPLLLSAFLRREGRRAHSPALEADAAHYASDYLTNLGVVVAFLADRLFSWHLADAIIACVIAAAILRLAWQVGVGAVGGLMDARLTRAEIREISEVVSRRSDVHGHHDLMTRRSGPDRFVQVHLEIDSARSFRDAHAIVESVRRDIERVIPNAVVTIHADPWPLEPEDAPPHPPRVPATSPE